MGTNLGLGFPDSAKCMPNMSISVKKLTCDSPLTQMANGLTSQSAIQEIF